MRQARSPGQARLRIRVDILGSWETRFGTPGWPSGAPYSRRDCCEGDAQGR